MSELLGLSFFLCSLALVSNSQRVNYALEREQSLEAELQKQKKLRDDERKARIDMQRQNRLDANEKDIQNGFHYQPIAFAESPFPDRRGTPRQPLLVPAARGYLRFQKKLVQLAHFEELKHFSHIWVLFVFHENTNTEKAHDFSKHGIAKIKPPRLHGKKVGCLSTRSPHRPNNIGLSVCEVISVGTDYIEVRGMDLVNGTPIIDVKPYIPYDIVPSEYVLPMATTADGTPLPVKSLTVPEWVVEADIPLKPVVFSPEAEENLRNLFRSNNTKGRISRSPEEALELIKQVLRQDIRSQHQGRGNAVTSPTANTPEESSSSTADAASSTVTNASYSCTLDGITLSFQHLADGILIETAKAMKEM